MKKTLLTLLSLLAIISAAAQSLGSSYFLDNRFIYGYKSNPAFIPNEGTFSYIGLLVNDVNTSANTNVGLSNLLFPYEGKLVSGFNENIPAEEFLGKLPQQIKSSVNLSQGIFSFGSRTQYGFVSVDANLNFAGEVFVPKTLIETLKLGTKSPDNVINDLGLDLNSYLELGVNYAFRVGKGWSIGLTAKGLVGIAAGRLDVQKFDVGSLHVNPMMLLQLGNSLVDFVPGGWGLAANIGANWDTPLKGLSVDLAVMNVGGMMNSRRKGKADYFQLMPITVNAGVKYALPVYDRLTFGLMGSVRIHKQLYYEARAGVNITPVNLLGIAFSAGMNSYGPNFGLMLNLRLPVITLYGGMDAVFTRFTPQFIPTGPVNTSARLGLVFTIGNAKVKKILDKTSQDPASSK